MVKNKIIYLSINVKYCRILLAVDAVFQVLRNQIWITLNHPEGRKCHIWLFFTWEIFSQTDNFHMYNSIVGMTLPNAEREK